ncbi:probable lipid phosphate phosphatase beta [Elaeis guineensis]|uniref:Probable lipid phosphate phosphatase beta n=1 Tax=Elaeis guineensis var. tenera TaxID=51953 RepID=A0A6I9RWY9_ELAGV|nr:probable lipid phosphate phosphatase beta [Elaeis guineensis]
MAAAGAATITTVSPRRPSLLHRLIALDTALSLRIYSLCRPVPRSFLKALEISGDGRFWFPIPFALLPFSSSASSIAFSLLLALLLGSLLDLLLVGLVKHLVRRPRPVYNKGMSLAFSVDHWSFPSGHASRVFFIASFLRLSDASLRRLLAGCGCIGAYYGGDPAELLVRLVLVWSAATSASRVLLGRHFVLDVVAGSCLGVLEAFIVFYFFNFYRF